MSLFLFVGTRHLDVLRTFLEPSTKSMTDSRKTKQQLIQELQLLRERLSTLETDAPFAYAPEFDPNVSQDRFRQIIEKSPIGMVIAGMDGYTRVANPAFCHMIGYSQEELRHLLVKDLTHPDDRELYPPLFEEIHAGDRDDYTLEKRFIHHNGMIVWTRVNTSIIRGPDHQALYYVALVEDISAAKEAETRLQRKLQTEELLTTLSTRFINLSSGQLDHEIRAALETLGHFVRVDHSFFHVLDPSAVRVRSVYQWRRHHSTADTHLQPEAFPWLLTQLQQGRIISTATVEDLPAEAHAERSAFEKAGIRSTLILPLFANQTLLGYVGFHTEDKERTWAPQDISLLKLAGNTLLNAIARKRANAALLDTNRLLRTLIDTIPDPAYAKDKAGRFLIGNTTVARIMGVEQPEELVGKTDFDFYPADLAEKYADDEANVIANQQPMINREEAVVDINTGEDLWILTTKAPLCDRTGQVTGIVGIGRDITQRKVTEEALRRAHAELEIRIQERTSDLAEANRQLRQEIAERRRVEEALRRAEREKEIILNGLQGHVSYYDAHFNVRWLNKQALNSLDMNLEDVVGRPCFEVVWGRDQVCPECPVRKAMDTLQMEEYERHMPDGSIWTLRGYPILDETGEVVGAVELSVDITERKRTEERLQSSEEKLRQFVAQSSDGILISDDQGRIIEWNPSAEEITGMNRSQVLGTPLWEVQRRLASPDRVTPGYISRLESSARRLVADEDPAEQYDTYERMIHSDGSEKVLQTARFPIHTQSGTLLGAILRDVTYRFQAEQRIQYRLEAEALVADISTRFISLPVDTFDVEIEKALRSVAQFVGVERCYLVQLDRDTQTVSREFEWCAENPASSQSSPPMRAQGVLMTPYRWLMERLEDGVPAMAPRVNSLPLEANMEKELWQSQGLASALALPIQVGTSLVGFWGFKSTIPVKPWSPEDLSLLGVISEIFANVFVRQWGEEALHVSEDRYRSLVEFSPNMIAIAIDGRVHFINSAGACMLGADTPEQLYGLPVLDFVHSRSRDSAAERFGNIESGSQPVPVAEEKWLRLDGQVIDIATSAVPVIYDARPAIQIVAYDITERKRIELEAVRNERLAALGRMSASLAHEINNPLQIIQSHLDLVLDFPLSQEDTREYLQVTREEINRLSHITRNVLNLAHSHSDKGTTAEVTGVLEHVLAVTRNEFDFQSIDVKTDIRPTQPVRISPEYLQQICLNLILNAMEAVSEKVHKQVHITAYQLEHSVLIEFCNNGPPIPSESLDHVFEPFFTTKPDGSGLGLWTTYNLLKDRGTLRVANLENDRGVTFTVTLPTATVHTGQDNESTAIS